MSRAGGMLLRTLDRLLDEHGTSRVVVMRHPDGVSVDIRAEGQEEVTGTGSTIVQAAERAVLGMDERGEDR